MNISPKPATASALLLSIVLSPPSRNLRHGRLAMAVFVFLFFLSFFGRSVANNGTQRIKHIELYTYPPGGQIRGYLPLKFFNKGVELEIKKIVTSYVFKEDIFFDIGMNAGFFTLHAAALGAHVVSFEPQIDCHSHMKRSLEQSGEGFNGHLRHRITLIHAALSNSSSIMAVAQGDCNAEFSIVSKASTPTTASPKPPTIVWNIPILPPRIFQRMYPVIKFLKIDTEGAEIPILEDLSHQINFHALVVELIPDAWASYGVSIDRGIKILEKLQKKSKEMFLLSDPEPFQITAEKASIPGTDVVALVGWKIKDMVQDRLSKQGSSGCNVFFDFR
jgi:FkbM family methyltransferase